MPTRIVLDDVPDTTTITSAAIPSPGRNPRRGSGESGFGGGDVENVKMSSLRRERHAPGGATTTATQQPSPTTALAPNRSSARKIVQFRSTILRDSSWEQELAQEERQRRANLSITDIRASPRLVGYVYQLLASLVMIITVVQFYNKSQEDADETAFQENIDRLRASAGVSADWRIFESVNGPVYYWKLVGCTIAATIAAVINFVVVMAHFDTVGCPKLWNTIFHDGSNYEQFFLRFMFLFWIGTLHICTSTLSVGEVQGNVFFTAWIGFISCILSYGVWRTSAGFPSFAERCNLHHRETTFNWLWLTFCEFVFACATTDKYFNRDIVELKVRGEEFNFSKRDWMVILGVTWSFVATSILALVFNHYVTKCIVINICGGRNQIYIGWRQSEGVVILGFLGMFFWLIYEHTGML